MTGSDKVVANSGPEASTSVCSSEVEELIMSMTLRTTVALQLSSQLRLKRYALCPGQLHFNKALDATLNFTF